MTIRDDIRKCTTPRVWSAAVAIVRRGGVHIDSVEDDEIRCLVKMPGRAVPHEVYLWPADPDWGCDCPSRQEACVHVAAAAISWCRRQDTAPPPSSPKTIRPPSKAPPATAPSPPARPHRPSAPSPSRVPAAPRTVPRHVRWVLLRRERRLYCQPTLVEQRDGEPRPRLLKARGPLSRTGAWLAPGDLEVESALLDCPDTHLTSASWPRVLAGLAEAREVYLDGKAISASPEPVAGVIRVEDRGRGFRVRLVRDPRIDEVFEGGVVRCGDTLHPSRQGSLAPHQRQALHRGVAFSPSEVGRLVSEFLPPLRAQYPVDVRTRRLPETTAAPPRLHLEMDRVDPWHLEVVPTLVYGDPPQARIDGDRLVLLSPDCPVPVRDPEAERRCRATCGRMLGIAPGHRTRMEAERAIDFASRVLPRFEGTVAGREQAHAFRTVEECPLPVIEVQEGARGGYRVEVDEGGVDPDTLLRAWQEDRPWVPLLEGGFAPVPRAWLEANGWRLAELLAARDRDGEVPRHTGLSLLPLLEAEAPRPASLERLRALVDDFEGLPQAPPVPGLRGTLRPYQERGVRWLAFLRSAGLGGVLADDMGLGKTVQALVALATTPGPHLVVAPTSVLTGWLDECRRFLPRIRTCLYHGPKRELDPDAHLVVTSYALLRRDLAHLNDVEWSYAVLDEAQAIKNPDSQVSRAARSLRARHRLALTGTPVENRLEELWSLFAFVLPGFLGGREDFQARIADSGGGAAPDSALQWLRQRVRPFILRRLKREVAPELPPRTDVVVPVTMDEDQQQLYDTVRTAVSNRALEALRQGRTFGALEALLRLRQAACHPALLPAPAEGSNASVPEVSSAKLEALLHRLEILAAEGHRALVFSQWTGFLDLVEPALEARSLAWSRLDGSTRDRRAVVDRFQSEDGPPVFLISLKAGGTGLNLTAADYVFHLDPWWNPAVEDQAVDRAHRIGQTRPVISVRLISQGTVEERIIALQEAKRDLARAAIGDEQTLTASLTREDLAALFT